MTRTDRDGLASLVQTHQAQLWRYLRALGCSGADAEDVLQETFLAVWRRPFEHRSPAESAAYLRSVARHQFLQRVRAQSRAPLAVAPEAVDAVWAEVDASGGAEAWVEALRECVAGLDGRTARAVSLRYGRAASREAMAAELGLGPEGVKSLLRRAREALRSCVERRIGHA